MKKIVLLALFVVAVVCQEATKATPVFWKVEADKPVYLLGTVHLGVDAAKEFPVEVWQNLRQCKTLVLEIDMSNVNQFAMMTKMQLPPGKTLDQLLGAEYWEKFKEFVKPQPAALFKGFKPWVVQSIAAQKFMPLTPAVEMTLMEKANKNGIKIEALETMEDQLGAIDAVPEEEHVKSIRSMLDDTDGARKEALALLSAYRKGDLEEIKKMALESEDAKEAPGMIEHVMVNRNKKWIPSIEKYIKKGNVFIAVGAGHFVGDQGVIKLLEAKGYKVTRIEYTQE